MKSFDVCPVICLSSLSCMVLVGCPEPDRTEDPIVSIDMTQEAWEDMSSSEEMSEELDLDKVHDQSVTSDAGKDMPRDLTVDEEMSPDLAEVDMDPPEYAQLHRFTKTYAPVSKFPDVSFINSSLEQGTEVLELMARARIDPVFTNTNGYNEVALEYPVSIIACGLTVPVRDVVFDEPETASTSDGYVQPRLDNDLLHLTMRGQGEIDLPLTGSFIVDESMVPEECELVAGSGGSRPFRMTVSVKNTPVMTSSFVSARGCAVFGDEPESGTWAAREGMPLGTRLNIVGTSDDVTWPLPLNIAPSQPTNLDVIGPEGLEVSQEPLAQSWPIPYTEHELRLDGVESFEVSSKTDEVVMVEPYFYVPGFAGNPRRLVPGEAYDDWHRLVNAMIVYVGALRTASGAELCTSHFPNARSPNLSVTITSQTPDVCVIQEASPLLYEMFQHPNPFEDWFVGKEVVHFERDGRCELSYEFYLDTSTPIHTTQTTFDVSRIDTLVEVNSFL